MSLWLAGASVALSGASFLTGRAANKSARDSEKKQARIESKYLGQQLSELDKVESNLDPVYQSKMGVAQGQFSQDLGALSSETGQSKEDLQLNFQNMIQKSGLATSGTANTKNSQMYKRIGNAFTRGQQGLMGRLGQNLGGIEEWYEGEKARLGSEKQRITFQKETADSKFGSIFSKIANNATKAKSAQAGG
tara:strand:+ start:199 stop:774 length:576 start_codon:yes stop_codon:yes gene_type:complete